MTPNNFEWLLRLYGPALASWPERERRAAFTLLRRSAQARGVLAEALASGALAGDEDQEGGADDQRAALARMQRGLGAAIAARQAPARLAAGARWGTLAACAAFGAWLGTAQAADQQAGDHGDPLQAIASLSPGSWLGALPP
jgi:hypothetical protein